MTTNMLDLRWRMLLWFAIITAAAFALPDPWPLLVAIASYLLLLFPVLGAPRPARPLVPPPPTETARTWRDYNDFIDPMLRAAAAETTAPPHGHTHGDSIRWMGYADQELTRLRMALGLTAHPRYCNGRPVYTEIDRTAHPPEEEGMGTEGRRFG